MSIIGKGNPTRLLKRIKFNRALNDFKNATIISRIGCVDTLVKLFGLNIKEILNILSEAINYDGIALERIIKVIQTDGGLKALNAEKVKDHKSKGTDIKDGDNKAKGTDIKDDDNKAKDTDIKDSDTKDDDKNNLITLNYMLICW